MSVRSESFFSHKKNFLVKTNGIFNYVKDVPTLKCGKKIISNTKFTNFNNVSLNLNFDSSGKDKRRQSSQRPETIANHDAQPKKNSASLIKIEKSSDIQITKHKTKSEYAEEPQISFDISSKLRNAHSTNNLKNKEKIDLILKTENDALYKDRALLKENRSYAKLEDNEADQTIIKPRLILTKNLIKDFYNLTSSAAITKEDFKKQSDFNFVTKPAEDQLPEDFPRMLKQNHSASNVSNVSNILLRSTILLKRIQCFKSKGCFRSWRFKINGSITLKSKC